MRLAAALMEAIGASDFAARLLEAVRPSLPASHCTIFTLQSNGRVEAISTASGIGEVATLTAVQYMRLGFDQQDTNMLWLAKRKPAARRQFWLSHQLAEDVADEAYRRLCYGEPGIRERLSLLSVFPEGQRIAVSFYRNHSYPDYTLADFDWAAGQAAIIATALMRHVELTGAGRLSDALQADRMASLPARERQLLAHVMEGKTTKEAARAMGISLTTALTYRYRAFQRLEIRSHRELIGVLRRG
ncbi:MAG TPA: LuxR C-terminal-related transcriptional regulator [Ramlibacter sp.]|nr:LuxR C-terminal-related transcriptional regulator [Ramlibacter sp.]